MTSWAMSAALYFSVSAAMMLAAVSHMRMPRRAAVARAMASRSGCSGSKIGMIASTRPERINAGSMRSGRLLAPKKTTFPRLVGSPKNCRSWLNRFLATGLPKCCRER